MTVTNEINASAVNGIGRMPVIDATRCEQRTLNNSNNQKHISTDRRHYHNCPTLVRIRIDSVPPDRDHMADCEVCAFRAESINDILSRR